MLANILDIYKNSVIVINKMKMTTIKLSDQKLKAALYRFVMDNYGVRLDPSKLVIELAPHFCLNGLENHKRIKILKQS